MASSTYRGAAQSFRARVVELKTRGDFPGKRRLLYKILSRSFLLRSIDRVRVKFSRPPLVID
jgi:hypothetical protein